MRPARPGEDPALKLIHGAILSGTILFFGVVYVLLFVVGCKLLYDGVIGLY